MPPTWTFGSTRRVVHNERTRGNRRRERRSMQKQSRGSSIPVALFTLLHPLGAALLAILSDDGIPPLAEEEGWPIQLRHNAGVSDHTTITTCLLVLVRRPVRGGWLHHLSSLFVRPESCCCRVQNNENVQNFMYRDRVKFGSWRATGPE